MPSIGTTVIGHYCGDTLASVSFFFEGEAQCACGDDAMYDGCCKNETKTFNIKDFQEKVNAFSFNPSNWLCIPSLIQVKKSFVTHHCVNLVSYGSKHPPDLVQQPLFLINNIFRI